MGNPGLILGLGTYTGEGNGKPLQYSCLENSMERIAWQAEFVLNDCHVLALYRALTRIINIGLLPMLAYNLLDDVLYFVE